MALLRPGRCGSRPQGGCLQHRTKAQRRPKGQDAGGTPALPGDAVPVVRWGVSGGQLLGKPTCTHWETPVCPRVQPPPCRADHSRVKQRTFMACREQGPHVPLIRLAVFGNIDRQDKQDERLLHKKLTGSIIECAFVENLSVLRGPSWTPFESIPTPWDPFADSSFAPLTDTLAPLVEISSPLPTFGGSLLSFLQPLRGPS